MSIGKTQQFGVSVGTPFQDNLPATIEQLVAVSIRHGSLVDSIKGIWRLSDGNLLQGEHHGGNGGSESIFVLQNGEYISKIIVRHGNAIDNLEFHTTEGRQFGPYGGNGGTPVELDKKHFGSSKFTLRGFFGHSGDYVNGIGFVVSLDNK